jgi:hypothetical protein
MLVDTHVISLGERFTFVATTPRLGKGKRRPDHRPRSIMEPLYKDR